MMKSVELGDYPFMRHVIEYLMCASCESTNIYNMIKQWVIGIMFWPTFIKDEYQL